jgi:hypothetical protein
VTQALAACLGVTRGSTRGRASPDAWLPHWWIEQIVGTDTVHQWLLDDRLPTSRLEATGEQSYPAVDVVRALAATSPDGDASGLEPGPTRPPPAAG